MIHQKQPVLGVAGIAARGLSPTLAKRTARFLLVAVVNADTTLQVIHLVFALNADGEFPRNRRRKYPSGEAPLDVKGASLDGYDYGGNH